MSFYKTHYEFASQLIQYTLEVNKFNKYLKDSTSFKLLFDINSVCYLLFYINNKSTTVHIYHDRSVVDEVVLPVIDYSTEFKLYDYMQQCYEIIKNTIHKFDYKIQSINQLQEPISTWLATYKEGYSFSAFQQAVSNDTECSYSYTLSSHITSKLADNFSNNINLTYNKNFKTILVNSYFKNDSPVRFDKVTDLKEFQTYKDFDEFLSRYTQPISNVSVAEIDIYLRKKNIDNFLENE